MGNDKVWQFFLGGGTQCISTVNCTEVTTDKPKQLAYKIFSIKRRF